MKLSRKQFDEKWAMQRHPQFKVNDKVVYYVVDLDSYEIKTLKDVHIINGNMVWTYTSEIIGNGNDALDAFLEMQNGNLVYYYDKDIEVFYKQELKGLNENLALIAAKNEISDIQKIKEIIIKDYYHNVESVYNAINDCDDSIEIEEIIQDILYNNFNLSYDEIITLSDDIVAEIIQEWIDDNVINNVIIDDVYRKFLDYANEITQDMDDEIYMEDNCMYLDVEYDSDDIISIIERYNLNTLKKLQAYIYYNTNGLIKLGRDVYIEIGL